MSNQSPSHLKRNFIWNCLGSSLYATTSLIFLIIVTRLNGVDEAGIFTFAFSNACVFWIIGTYAGRSYQVTEQDKTLSGNIYFQHRLVSCAFMLLAGLLFALIRGYADFKLTIVLSLIVYKTTDAFSEVLYGINQSANRLDQVGLSMFLKGLLGPLIFFITDILTHHLFLACTSIVLANSAIILLYDLPTAKRNGLLYKPFNRSLVFKIFRLGFFAFSFALLTQYLINAPKYSIDRILAPDSQAIYGIISMPATVMVLAANFLVHPFLLKIKNLLELKDPRRQLNILVIKLSCAMIVFGIISVTLGFFLGRPVFLALYGIDISPEIISLVLILIGATLYALSFILSNTLTAMRKTASQAFAFLAVSIITLFLSSSLVSSRGVYGGALAYLLSMSVLAVFYIALYLYSIRLFDRRVLLSNDQKSQLHSFVVLAYQESPFLESCIKSVLRQSLQTNVIIFTTTPNKHVKSLAKKYHLAIKTAPHTSIGGDFDAALNAADTPLVTIAHQDDIYDKDYAQQVVEHYCRAGQDTQILFTDYYELRNNQKTCSNTNLNIKRILLSPLRIDANANRKWAKRFVLRFGNAISCPAVTFNKDKVKTPLFDCKMSCNVDWQAWEKLSRQPGKFIFISQLLMGHRIHDESETSKTLKDDRRSTEDFTVYRRFWPTWIAKRLTRAYKASEKSNQI